MRALVRRLAGTALASVALVACRDAVEPFQPSDRETPVDRSVLRLTYGTSDDRTPAWSADGDSIYFTASSWEGNPLAPATVLALAADGMGSLTPLLRNVQEGTGRMTWIAAPAPTGDGERIAFVRLRPLLPEAPCVGTRVCPLLSNLPMVRLTTGEVHTRAIDATHGLEEDVALPLVFEGHSIESDSTAPGGSLTVSDYHPFHYEFEVEGRAFFRPSWNPAGTELVVSDGLRLLRWTIGGEAVAIPGTEDGVSPAWSPDGDWIAYVRHARLSGQTFICEYQLTFPSKDGPPVLVNQCIERRTIYETAAPEIVLVRPDGSEHVVLGQGVDPAWSPDGNAVFVSTELGIVRMPLGDGPTTLIADTERGVEPAVSPDGGRLAFARRALLAKPATHDIFVVELE